MAKIHIERAYIESEDIDDDTYAITIHCNNVLVGKVEMPPRIWLYTMNNEDGDLVINNSAGMEDHKWDHITKEILGETDNG